MSLLMGALGGLGQGMIKIGSNLNERLAEDVKNQRAENMLRLGIELQEESSDRTARAAEARDVEFSQSRLDRKIAEEEGLGEARAGTAAKVTTAAKKAELDFTSENIDEINRVADLVDQRKLDFKGKEQAQIRAQVDAIPGLSKQVKDLTYAQAVTGVPLLSFYSEQNKLAYMQSKDRADRAPKAMSAKDSTELYLKTVQANVEALTAENNEVGYFGTKLTEQQIQDKARQRTLRSLGEAAVLAPQAGAMLKSSRAIGSITNEIIDKVKSGDLTVDQALSQATDKKHYGLPEETLPQLRAMLGVGEVKQSSGKSVSASKPMPSGGASGSYEIPDPRQSSKTGDIIDPNLGKQVKQVGSAINTIVTAPADLLTKVLGAAANKLSSAGDKSRALSIATNKRKQGIITYDEYVSTVNAINSK